MSHPSLFPPLFALTTPITFDPSLEESRRGGGWSLMANPAVPIRDCRMKNSIAFAGRESGSPAPSPLTDATSECRMGKFDRVALIYG